MANHMHTTTLPADLLDAFLAYLDTFDGEPVASFRSGIRADMPARALEPASLACLRHLDRIAEIAPSAAHPLVRLLADHRAALDWRQTYTPADFGQTFIDNYGWLELFGTRGLFASETMAGGVLILGPGITYPDHHHVAEEIYIPLTGGTLWRKGNGALAEKGAGEVIHHPSNVNHAMRTGAEPLLALYLWRGGPLAQRSVVTASADGA
jgi:quercetin dioxygenase-like cupin family protein